MLITGGLSGIGKGTALELAKGHLTIIIFNIQKNKATDVVKQDEVLDSNCKHIHCNLTKHQEVNMAFNQIKQQYHHVGYLVTHLITLTVAFCQNRLTKVINDEINGLIDLDIKSIMYCMINELKFMTVQGFKRIVNTTSGAGLVAGKGMALYSACKHAVVSLTKAAALENYN